jgi:hypothetical protein
MSRITEINGIGVADMPAFQLGPFDRVVEVSWSSLTNISARILRDYESSTPYPVNFDASNLMRFIFDGTWHEFNGQNYCYRTTAKYYSGYPTAIVLGGFQIISEVSGYLDVSSSIDEVAPAVDPDDVPLGIRTLTRRFVGDQMSPSTGMPYDITEIITKVPGNNIARYFNLNSYAASGSIPASAVYFSINPGDTPCYSRLYSIVDYGKYLDEETAYQVVLNSYENVVIPCINQAAPLP